MFLFFKMLYQINTSVAKKDNLSPVVYLAIPLNEQYLIVALRSCCCVPVVLRQRLFFPLPTSPLRQATLPHGLQPASSFSARVCVLRRGREVCVGNK